MRLGPCLAVVGVLMAGCLEQASILDDGLAEAALPLATLKVGDVVVDAATGFRWSGETGKGSKQTFSFAAPTDFWTTHTGNLEASVVWAHNATGSFSVSIQDASGRTLKEGTEGWYASVALVPNAKPGDYKVVIDGAGPYGGARAKFDAIIQLDAKPITAGTATPRLPNLVTIPPVDIRIESPELYAPGGNNGPTRGCGYDETAEHRALRCLRVSNGVGNIGDGPLEVRLSFGEAAKAPAGMGVWMQRIYNSDGSVKEVPVGNAVFHATHGHWHYSGLAKFDLYKYDLGTKTRGEAVGKSNKNGFCFFDIGLVELGLPDTPMKAYSGSACLAPNTQQQAWFMGLSPNWFDFYHWNLPDQYVEITGLADGTYELVSTASGAGLLHESNKDDNTASAVVRIKGNQVETLASWSDYQR
jgi:hypothetical protein